MLRATRLDGIDLVQQKTTRVTGFGARPSERNKVCAAQTHVTGAAVERVAQHPAARATSADLQIAAVADCIMTGLLELGHGGRGDRFAHASSTELPTNDIRNPVHLFGVLGKT